MEQGRAVAGGPDDAVASRMLGIARVEGQGPAEQEGEHLLGFGRGSAGVAGLRGVYGREGESACDAAEAGDLVLIDLGQGLERKAPEVEVCTSLGVVLAAFGFAGGERFEGAWFEKLVAADGNGHGFLHVEYTGIIYLFI